MHDFLISQESKITGVLLKSKYGTGGHKNGLDIFRPHPKDGEGTGFTDVSVLGRRGTPDHWSLVSGPRSYPGGQGVSRLGLRTGVSTCPVQDQDRGTPPP